jgi:hypothetical protein
MGQYNYKVDVYAYAIVMWEVATGDIPYRGLESTQIIAQVMMNDMRPTIPNKLPEGIKKLLAQCWSRDPINRPSFAEIVKTFRTGNIFLDGCDIDRLMVYIKSVDAEEDISIQQLQKCMASLKTSPNHLSDFVSILENEGVPVDLADECWETIIKYKDTDNELFLRALVPFLQSKMAVSAADYIRKSNDIPFSLANKITGLLPTGDETIDEALVVTACKNDCAVEALQAALNPEHIKLLLEVIGQKSCEEEDKENVAAIAVKHLSSEDNMLVVAALRCLVGIDKVECISIDTIRSLLGTSNKVLKNAAYIVTSAMASKGIQIPIDLLDGIASRSSTDPFGASVLISACNDKTTANHMISMIEHGLRCPIEVSLKILIVASKHRELAPQISSAAKSLSTKTDEFKSVIAKLQQM